MLDRTGLAEFLRRRREALQPGDVGLPQGQRRRTAGLRREEVAGLCLREQVTLRGAESPSSAHSPSPDGQPGAGRGPA